MSAARDDRIVELTARLAEIEGTCRERGVVAKVYQEKLQEVSTQMKELEDRLHTIQRAVDIIQTRMAMWSALAALAGAVVGQVLVKLVGFIPH